MAQYIPEPPVYSAVRAQEGLATGRSNGVAASGGDAAASPAAGGARPLTRTHIALLALAVIAGVVALMVQDGWVADRYMTDDAFISFRYARHLADGIGPVWSRGDRVEGYTNFGWVLAIALAMKAGASPIDASRALGLAASAGVLASVPYMASQFRPRGSGAWWAVTLGAMAALSLNTGLALWTFAGLETTAFTLFVTLGVAAFLAEERRGRATGGSGLLLFVAALIRPDGVVVFAVAAAWRWGGVAVRRDGAAAGRALGWSASFAAPFAAYWGWRWWYYGDFFSNTYYLKTGGGREFYERGGWYARDFISDYWAWLALAAGFSAWRERQSAHGGYRASAFALALLAAWMAYVAASGGDWMPYFRFFVPVLPLLYVVMLHGLIDVAAAAASLVRTRQSVVRAVLVAVAVAAVAGSSLRAYDDTSARDPSGFHSDILPGSVKVSTHRAIGLWLRDHLPPDATVAQIATGIVPYYSDLPTLDMLGVNDRHIARLDHRVPHQPAGHDKEDGAYILLAKPAVIWLSVGPEGAPRSRREDYAPPIDERIAPVITSITQNLYLWVDYHPVAIRLEEGWLNLIVRNDVVLRDSAADAAPPPATR